MNIFCEKHNHLINTTLNEMVLCDKCLEEIYADEKLIKERMQNEKNNSNSVDNK